MTAVAMTAPASFLRRRWRRLVHRLRPPGVEFVYSHGYSLPIPGVLHDAERGAHVLTFLAAEGLLKPRAVHEPQPLSLKALARVHSDAYLESLHDRQALVRVLGFAPPDGLQDRILELQRLMAGGTLLAARLTLDRGGAAINLGGGFHHAFPDHGERFCLFNDVAAAIATLRAGGFDDPVLVVDLDLHDGDGTRAIFADDPTVHTFSVHNQTNRPAEAVEATVIELGGGIGDAAYLALLRERLPPVFARVRPGLAFYLAGADPAYDDALGDWRITPRGMIDRDRLVAGLVGLAGGGRRVAGRRGAAVPLAIVLAGGYGRHAWRYAARFCAWLLAGDPIEPPSTEEITLARYRRLARQFEPSELTGEAGGGEDNWGLTEADVVGSLDGMSVKTRLLGYYSRHGIELVLERAGFLDRLRHLGFVDLELEFDLDNPAGETVRMWAGGHRRELLMELRVRRDVATVPGCEMLRVEWLMIQNPRQAFPTDRAALPGQKHPGLGFLRDVVAFLVLACERLKLDGILFVPSHYHLGAQSRKVLRFVDPVDEARFRALRQALAGLDLGAATRAVAAGQVRDAATSQVAAWRPVPMVVPVSERLKERVLGDEYEAKVAAAAAGFRFELAAGG